MALLQEDEIIAFELKEHEYVCPPCATDEEKEVGKPLKTIHGRDIHDSEQSFFCTRCKKKIESPVWRPKPAAP